MALSTSERKSRWRKKHPNHLSNERKSRRKWYSHNKDRANDSRLKYQYGIDSRQYEEMLESQNYVCKICLRPERSKQNNKTKKLVVDHDHITGKVRGLLCGNCNAGIGMFEDNTSILRNAIKYLES
jgi:hypothetical protein